jgi:hypothetical protein
MRPLLASRPARVAWLKWDGAQEWFCERCGRRGTLPDGCTITTFVMFLNALEREHRNCPEPKPKEDPNG